MLVSSIIAVYRVAPVAMLDEVSQDVKHERFKFDKVTGAAQFTALRVEHKVAKDIEHPQVL